MKLLSFCLLALAACATAPEPELPIVGSTAMAMPVEYSAYWADVEACSGFARPSGVTFYVATTGVFTDGDGVRAIGEYQYAARRITLGSWAVHSPDMIRHEMLHAVLPDRYAGQHPVEYFGVPGSWDGPSLGKCGAIVVH